MRVSFRAAHVIAAIFLCSGMFAPHCVCAAQSDSGKQLVGNEIPVGGNNGPQANAAAPGSPVPPAPAKPEAADAAKAADGQADKTPAEDGGDLLKRLEKHVNALEGRFGEMNLTMLSQQQKLEDQFKTFDKRLKGIETMVDSNIALRELHPWQMMRPPTAIGIHNCGRKWF